MRIDSSVVAMQSERSYYSATQKQKADVTQTPVSVILSISGDAREQMENSINVNGQAVGQSGSQEKSTTPLDLLMENTLKSNQAAQTGFEAEAGESSEISNFKLQMLRSLISAMKHLQRMNAKRGKPVDMSAIKRLEQQYRQEMKKSSQPAVAMPGAVATNSISTGSGNRTAWTRTVVESEFVKETENTAFQTQGTVTTEDGRIISFNISVEMSREFEGVFENVSTEDVIFTDPLVINLEKPYTEVTDQKFMFDIDCDGDEESISFVGEGSGFLALDRNNDGVINDGSELFGTASGDGFKDLAQYDSDGNGWIDEADAVFEKLKIWTKDEYGNDSLIDLKEAGVGAIYLGSTDTRFSLNDMHTNETDAVVRKMGVYLKENGQAGTMSHVDLAL